MRQGSIPKLLPLVAQQVYVTLCPHCVGRRPPGCRHLRTPRNPLPAPHPCLGAERDGGALLSAALKAMGCCCPGNHHRLSASIPQLPCLAGRGLSLRPQTAAGFAKGQRVVCDCCDSKISTVLGEREKSGLADFPRTFRSLRDPGHSTWGSQSEAPEAGEREEACRPLTAI